MQDKTRIGVVHVGSQVGIKNPLATVRDAIGGWHYYSTAYAPYSATDS